MNGTGLTPRSDPPAINDVPWNSLTLVLAYDAREEAGRRVVAGTDVDLAIKEQLNIAANVNLQYKIHSVRVWDRTSSTEEPSFLNLECADLVHTATPTQTYRSVYTSLDRGSKMNNARLGFQWPKNHQTVVFDSTNAMSSIYFVDTPAGISVTDHLRLLWRHTPPGVLPSRFQSPRAGHQLIETLN